MLPHPLRPGVFVLYTPNTPALGRALRLGWEFRRRLWRVVLDLDP
ncbi:hypothetical protein ACFFX1_54910 [Dactylosporangium sucinum]|nr:hypothetical protein [Dactylosporangium sucinum]